MSQLHQLLHLQEIDSEIRDKKQRLREVLTRKKADEELQEARRRKERTETTLSKARSRQTDLELELGQVNANARRSEERLYSGRVKNPKELEDLQQSIAALGRRRDALEDQILEAMLAVEEATEEDEAAREQLEQVEEEWAKLSAALESEQDELARRLNELLELRKQQVERLEPALLKTYEATAARHGGVGVAALKHSMCQVCGVRTSGSKERAARAGELVYCGSCDRILVMV